jgi:hypothetical protein
MAGPRGVCQLVQDEFLGELTEAALRVASRHGVRGFSVDQEIGLWKRLGEVLRRWEVNPDSERTMQETLSAELAEAAYEDALQKGSRGSFLDVQLDFWRALRQVTSEGDWTRRNWRWFCRGFEGAKKSGRRSALVAVA